MYVLDGRVTYQRQRLRDAGYPVTLAELDAWYGHPTGPNAAEAFGDAIAAIVRDEALEARSPLQNWKLPLAAPTEPIPEDQWQAMAAIVELNRAALNLADRASTATESRWVVDVRDLLAIDQPHLTGARELARLLETQALVAAHRGDASEAVQAIATIVALGRSFRNEPTTIPQLIHVSILALGMETAAQVIHRTSLNAA